MKDFEIILEETPKLTRPVFLEGLPGIGNVGRLCAQHLVGLFSAKRFGGVHSSSFPHQVKALPDGTVRLMRNDLYYITDPREIIILSGDMQPLPTDFRSHYRMSQSILELCASLGVELVITMGGYGSSGNKSHGQRVFLAASVPELAREYADLGTDLLDGGHATPIVGATGLIPAMAARFGTKAICLLGETSASIRPDAEAAARVLRRVAQVLKIEIDLSGLKDSAELIEKEMKDIIKRIEEVEGIETGLREEGRDRYIY